MLMLTLLTLTELADRWRLSPSSIQRLAESGEIPCVHVDRNLHFLKSAIEAWDDKREYGAAKPQPKATSQGEGNAEIAENGLAPFAER